MIKVRGESECTSRYAPSLENSLDDADYYTQAGSRSSEQNLSVKDFFVSLKNHRRNASWPGGMVARGASNVFDIGVIIYLFFRWGRDLLIGLSATMT